MSAYQLLIPRVCDIEARKYTFEIIIDFSVNQMGYIIFHYILYMSNKVNISRKQVNKRRKIKKTRKIREQYRKSKTLHKKNVIRTKQVYRGGAWNVPDKIWVLSSEVDADEICPLCLEKFTDSPSKVVYKTSCKHLFHNNCLNYFCKDCTQTNKQPFCPLCRNEMINDLPFNPDFDTKNFNIENCENVSAFRNKDLENYDETGGGSEIPLFEGNPALNALYDGQPDP